MSDKIFTKSSLFGWCLFDFAHSIPAVIGGVYFAKWFTEDLHASSVLFNLLFFSSSCGIVLTGSWVGNSIDKHGYKFWIVLSSGITVLSTLSIFAASQYFPKTSLVIPSFFLFLFFLFGYQVSRICHNVYLRGIIPERQQSKMSGYGAASNWAGSIFGILLTVPIVTNYSESLGRELTFLVAGIASGILIPVALLLMFRSNRPVEISVSKENIDLKTWRSLLSSIGVWLLIYLLLFDVMATVQRNLPPYLSTIFKMPDDTQALGFLLILLSALFGGIFAAHYVNFTNSATWLKRGSIGLGVAITFITLKSSPFLWVAFGLAGFAYGVLESSIRVNFMGNFSPETAGENFGILAVVERTSGVVGPLIWIIPFYIFSEENTSYVTAMLLMAGMAFASFLILIRTKTSVINKEA